ncbi:MAG: hypothetical protein ACI8YQ_003112 [Polaribacter sp.]|jgi:hypothetical protein
MKKYLFLFCLCFLFASCEDTAVNNNTTADQTSGDNNKDPKKDVSETAATNKDQTFESLGKELAFDEFNSKIKKAKEANEEWVASPLSVMLNFTGADVDSNVKSVRSKKIGPGENIQDVMVTVEEDGIMDDSVSGTITILRMKKVDGTWQVYKATQAWKCWKGRGHETYSALPCN